MKFRLTAIRLGYAEIWMNDRAGERYKRVATILRDECSNGKGQAWHVSTKEFATTKEFDTRRECVRYFMRRMLFRQAERAIGDGKGFSTLFWHCPCRDALIDMRESGLFTWQELRDTRLRMEKSCAK